MTTPSPPRPGFIASTVVTTWLDTTPAGPVAWLLIGHPGPRRPGETAESIEAELSAMSEALGLRAPFEYLPDTGARLTLAGSAVAFDYGHPAYSLRLPPTGTTWRAHLTAGGPACVLVGLDPVPPGAGPDAIDDYLTDVLATGRARMGATRLRTPAHRRAS